MEQVKFKDVAHLYVGANCKVQGSDESEESGLKLTGISFDGTQNILWAYFDETETSYAHIDDCAPILRPLSSINQDELQELGNIMGWHNYCSWRSNQTLTPHGCVFLLSKHFDLFNLIESGQAIDATQLSASKKS